MCTTNVRFFPAISQYFKSILVFCEDKTAAALFVVIGFMVTLWANCLLTICYSYATFVHFPNNNNETLILTGKLIYVTLELTYYITTFTAIIFFISGIKQNNRGLLVPWLVLKLFELIILLCSCVILFYFGNPYNHFLISFGIVFFSVGLYTYFCVLHTYHELMPKILVEVSENPPSYDSAVLIYP